MLRWRLILGVVIVAALAGLCWLDIRAYRPGAYLAPLAVVVTWLCAGELLAMFQKRGYHPERWSFYTGAMLPVLVSCVPVAAPRITANYTMGALGWLAIGLIAGLITAFLGEMKRFDGAGKSIVNVAVSAFAVLYIGGCMGAIVQMRLVRTPMSVNGLDALLPLLAFLGTVKLSDICQYAVGRLFGRRKLAPKLSPGKTWEGAIGGVGLACGVMSTAIASYIYGWKQLEPGLLVGSLCFTSSVAVTAIIGDLAESLLKRDAGLKDSSNWLPGFGGVLDLTDSLLLSAPIAYLWFVNGFMEPLQKLNP